MASREAQAQERKKKEEEEEAKWRALEEAKAEELRRAQKQRRGYVEFQPGNCFQKFILSFRTFQHEAKWERC